MTSPYRLLGLSLFPLVRFRIRKITGLENLPASGGYIIAANHQSWIDSLMIAAALHKNIRASLRYVAQSSKYRFLGGIPIDEYDKSRVIDVALGYLRAGHPIVIFPEGNSNTNPELRTGRTGAARLALRSGLPVVPVGVQGTEGVKAWQSLIWFLMVWRACRITIGQALSFAPENPATVSHTRLMEVTEQIMLRISHYCGKPYLSSLDSRLQERTANWAKRFLRTMAAHWVIRRVQLHGIEHLPDQGPYIVAANHFSYFDPISVAAVIYRERHIQPYFLTKGSIARKWRFILGSEAHDILGMLPVDEKNPGRAVESAVKHLNNRGVVGIFPEGTRNREALNPNYLTTMLKAKTGLARMVLVTGVPVIPAGIVGPQGTSLWRTFLNIFRFWQPIVIRFGPPVDMSERPLGEPTKEDLKKMMRPVMHRIGQLCGLKYTH